MVRSGKGIVVTPCTYMRRRPTWDEMKLVRSKQENVPEAFKIKDKGLHSALPLVNVLLPDVALCVPHQSQIPPQ